MSKTQKEWIDAARQASCEVNGYGDIYFELPWLAGSCSTLEHQNEELQAALNQARADRDHNEEVLIRLRNEKFELEKQLRDVQSYADAQFEQACRMEMQRNQERQRQSGRNDE